VIELVWSALIEFVAWLLVEEGLGRLIEALRRK
jgi:hypothetical protein